MTDNFKISVQLDCTGCNTISTVNTDAIPELKGIYCPLCGEYNPDAWGKKELEDINQAMDILISKNLTKEDIAELYKYKVSSLKLVKEDTTIKD